MKFETPLLPGKLLKRYKRFLADIALQDGQVVTAHCANPGSMSGLLVPLSTVWVRSFPEESPRTLKYSWEIVRVEKTLVGINTAWPNRLVAESLEENFFPELSIFSLYKTEVKYGENSRIDFLLSNEQQQKCYLEVKNVHLKRGHEAQFPDAVTARGAKHLKDLISVRESGHRAVMLYIVQRNDCDVFTLAEDIDFFYTQQAHEAYARGVEFIAYDCTVTVTEIKLRQRLEVKF